MNAVEIENGKIVGTTDCTGEFVLPDNYKTISKAMYDSIGAIPCSFTEVAGEITSIEYIEPLPEPTPEPTELELLQEDNASLWYELMMGGM